MIHFEIRRPDCADAAELHDFFTFVITDTFVKEGIAQLAGDLEQEIAEKIQFLKDDLRTGGQERRFFIASDRNQIIGTISTGQPNKLIRDLTEGALDEQKELGTILVHPEFQGRGVANALIDAAIAYLQHIGATAFCFDCGYKAAQQKWKRKFGEPTYRFRDYWGEGSDHLIWSRSIQLGDSRHC